MINVRWLALGVCVFVSTWLVGCSFSFNDRFEHCSGDGQCGGAAGSASSTAGAPSSAGAPAAGAPTAGAPAAAEAGAAATTDAGSAGESGATPSDTRVTLLEPKGTVSDSQPKLSWSVSDLVGVTYAVELATTSDFASPLQSARGLGKPTYSPSEALPSNADYYWRVAVEQNGELGAWSQATFHVDIGAVVLLSPVAAALTNQQSPSLKWLGPPTATSYDLTISTNADLTNAVKSTGITETSIQAPFTLSSSKRQVYYWTVAPRDAHGILGSAAPVSSFTLDTVAPTGKIVLDDGAATTHEDSVTVTLTAEDANSVPFMYLSRDGSFSDGKWQSFSSSLTIDNTNLSNLNSATIAVSVRFRDAAGNVSEPQSASIALRRTLVQAAVVSSSTQWTAGQSPYYVTNDVVFDVGAPLTIAEGTEVYFRAGKSIDIRDQISVLGTEASPVVMHGARIEMRHVSNVDPAYARFEHVQLVDGAIHLASERSFSMRNSIVHKLTAPSFSEDYIEHSKIDDLEGDGSYIILPYGGTYVDLDNTKIVNSYLGTVWLDAHLGSDLSRCRIGVFHLLPSLQPIAFNTIEQVLLAETGASFHDDNLTPSDSVSFTLLPGSKATTPVSAMNNYWGVTTTAAMQAGTADIAAIHDVYDDSSLAHVDYSGFASAPIEGAGPDW